jgi:hypothetical protein
MISAGRQVDRERVGQMNARFIMRQNLKRALVALWQNELKNVQ